MAKKQIEIGEKTSVPIAIAGKRTVIVGIAGSGKSNTATVIVENLLLAGEQVVIVDPKGEGFGLLSNTDGSPSDLPIIAFGPNGHVETFNETHATSMADFVVNTGRSVILNLAAFENDKTERRFVADFLRRLYRRKSTSNTGRTLVVIEEAALFVPEEGTASETASAIQRIVRQGRSFGLGTLLVDQRPADVAKKVLTQCDTLICHQLVHNTDRSALKAWIQGYDRQGRGEEFLESLASLKPGEAWIWSPGWLKCFHRDHIYPRTTYDTGAAPDSKVRKKKLSRGEVDLDALRSQMAEVVAQEEAENPKLLQKKNAELQSLLTSRERELAEKIRELSERPPVVVAAPAMLDPVALKELTEDLKLVIGEAVAVSQNLQAAASELSGQPTSLPTSLPASLPAPTPRVAPPPVPSVKRTQAAKPEPSGNPGDYVPTSLAVKIFETIATLEARKLSVDRDAVARWMNVHPNNNRFNTELARLREHAYLDGLALIKKALHVLGDYEPDLSAEAMRRMLRTIDEFHLTMYQALKDAYPGALSRDKLAKLLNVHPNNNRFNTVLARFRQMKLIPERGNIVLTATVV